MNSIFDFKMDKRGQAALVDSLFFIAIVSALGTGLFYFAINYGLSSESMLNSFYSSDFATDALKVLTYVNITRDGRVISPDMRVLPSDEFDYLFAMIKEDYAENNSASVKITFQTQKYIASTLYAVLKPFDSAYDYVFFISKEGATKSDQTFLVVIFALHNPITLDDGTSGVERVYYSCIPKFSNFIEKTIFPNAGAIDSALGKISLCESSLTCSPYLLGLNIWISKKAQVFTKIVDGTDQDFSCTLIEGIVSQNVV